MPKKVLDIIIFEDERVDRLYPLTLTRPAWDLLCGTRRLLERIRGLFPEARLGFWVREWMVDYVSERFPDVPVNQPPQGNGLLVNARLVDVSVLSDPPSSGGALCCDELPVVAAFEAAKISRDFQHGGTAGVIRGFKERGQVPASAVVNYPWELMADNGAMIVRDAEEYLRPFDFFGEADPQAIIRGQDNVRCGVGTRIEPYSVIDGTSGPVIMGRNVTIEPQVFIQGPVFIGDDTLVRSHARIYGGTSIGQRCKVGGEISGSIIHGYTNKQHDGYLGNAVVGSWCNLGAGTTVSNLKNNYTPVKVQVGGDIVDTGSLFVGPVIGDHSTTAIGTMLNTGTVVGVASFIYGDGIPERFVPSFRWGIGKDAYRQDFDKSVVAIQEMMKRRDKKATDEYLKVLEKVYEMEES
jgi:UDP-N-acetylglucosamine diphosphorylase/glucosamine-1-phosphate N-acetyltransferase